LPVLAGPTKSEMTAVKANAGERPGAYLYLPQRDITTYELALLVPVLMESKLPRPEGMRANEFPNGDLYQIFRFDYERLGHAARHLKVITEPSEPPKEILPPRKKAGAQ
ncbi:MAG TPA: hypothetical protein VN937_06175, partial [Blastocatellia bacterium]|nr:hypothetical protein [Blastocatellia bacterium]